MKLKAGICTLPIGDKSDMTFVIAKNPDDPRCILPDDCGAWNKSKYTRNHYVVTIDGDFQYIEKKGNKWYKAKHNSRELLKNQPSEEQLLVLKRIYVTSQHDQRFKKRISFFEHIPIRLI